MTTPLVQPVGYMGNCTDHTLAAAKPDKQLVGWSLCNVFPFLTQILPTQKRRFLRALVAICQTELSARTTLTVGLLHGTASFTPANISAVIKREDKCFHLKRSHTCSMSTWPVLHRLGHLLVVQLGKNVRNAATSTRWSAWIKPLRCSFVVWWSISCICCCLCARMAIIHSPKYI